LYIAGKKSQHWTEISEEIFAVTLAVGLEHAETEKSKHNLTLPYI